jgi:hypothetical protein
MHDAIVTYLRNNLSASSEELARTFLKFVNPDHSLAEKAVSAIIGKDSRIIKGSDGLWRASPEISGNDHNVLNSLPLNVVHGLFCCNAGIRRIFHVSAWKVFPEIKPELNVWLQSETSLNEDEKFLLQSANDTTYSAEKRHACLNAVKEMCGESKTIFFSSEQYVAIKREAIEEDLFISDDIFLVSQFFNAAHIPVPRPISLVSCYRALFERTPVLASAASYGKVFAECIAELADRLSGEGIITLDDFEKAQDKALSFNDFSGKKFTGSDLSALPGTPGVYAFKTLKDEFLYIGQTSSLKRRITGYFRESDESPEKLSRIRKESNSLVTYQCGSELESLIYEYRLIRKHAPLLNSKIDINERKGSFVPVNDCIILLPSASVNEIMSFWFRRGQKIKMKRIVCSVPLPEDVVKEIGDFFFSDKLPADKHDFPEQEIATRWIKSHENEFVYVPVNRMKDAAETARAIIDYSHDMPFDSTEK